MLGFGGVQDALCLTVGPRCTVALPHLEHRLDGVVEPDLARRCAQLGHVEHDAVLALQQRDDRAPRTRLRVHTERVHDVRHQLRNNKRVKQKNDCLPLRHLYAGAKFNAKCWWSLAQSDVREVDKSVNKQNRNRVSVRKFANGW